MKLFPLICAAAIGAVSASSSFAAIVSASGPLSNLGSAAAIIAAPSDVLDVTVTNTGMQGFDEAQNVVLAAPLTLDNGTVAAGTRVNSHMIFLNAEDTLTGALTHFGVTWTFTNRILGVMSDVDGLLESASTPFLGALGTNYASFSNRGLEINNGTGLGADGYTISGNMLTLGMEVTQPGDWVRVVTTPIPVPAALPLLAGALGGLGLLRARKTKSAA